MSNDKMSDELQIAIRRSPEYTAPSAELVALRAEVAGWRRAVRWVDLDDGVWGLRFSPVSGAPYHEFGRASEFADGSVVFLGNGFVETSPDRNAACTRVCELLGIPVVLPVGGE